MKIHFNPRAPGAAPGHIRDTVDASAGRELQRILARCPAYKPTPLLSLEAMALQAGVASIHYKDESQRFALRSFKALGGSYAVARVLHRLHWPALAGFDPSLLLAPAARAMAAQWTVACATDGNHGRAVAAGARLFGCACVVFLHAGVSAAREAAIAALGARIVRVRGDYDESVRAAHGAAMAHGWTVVSDTSYQGYDEIPRWVMEGYTVMLAEVADQSAAPVTHVFVQAGVGGLAAAVGAWYWQQLGEYRPVLVVVEPAGADCLYQSARAGGARQASAPVETMLAGLACGAVSSLAWDVLREAADAFMLIDDAQALRLMWPLAMQGIEAGESATAGLAGLLAVAADRASAARLGLSASSRVLVIGTEGATDPELYRHLIS
ncbi:MAG: diaminopropionate ammonia-lyase [Pseudomonadota bacterium]